MLRSDWIAAVQREGVSPVVCRIDPTSEHLPCPACGHAAALVRGACADCGLQLE